MRTLEEMTLAERIDILMSMVEEAEMYLSQRKTPYEDLKNTAIVLSDVYLSIKEEFVDQQTRKINIDTFYNAMNSKYPGLIFRTNSIIAVLAQIITETGNI